MIVQGRQVSYLLAHYFPIRTIFPDTNRKMCHCFKSLGAMKSTPMEAKTFKP